MLDTWGDSWFEEGTRVFYVVPAATVDEILPLTISPAPAVTVRAFVGRVEVITPAMETIVLRAFLANDTATLDRYGRLIGPIGDRLMAKSSSRPRKRGSASLLTERLRALAAARRLLSNEARAFALVRALTRCLRVEHSGRCGRRPLQSGRGHYNRM